MCDDNTSQIQESSDNDDTVDENTGNHLQTDNDSDSDVDRDQLLGKLKRLQELLAIQDEEEEWNPTLEFTSEYIGNGFVDIAITQCNCPMTQFELKYCFQNATIATDELPFKTKTITPRKLKQNELLIRIPQRIHDYYFIFQFRGHAQHEQTLETQWTEYSKQKSIIIPFDAPEYQFKIGELVHFQLPNNPFWSIGQVQKISEEKVADILYKRRGKEDEIFKISVANLKFEERYRNKLIDLTDWMDLSKQLLLNGKNEKVQEIFVAVHDTLESNMNKWLYNEDNAMTEEEQMSFIDLTYFGDVDQDIKCCTRFIAINVVEFLDVDSKGVTYCNDGTDWDVINNDMSIGCGLCPIKSHYQTKSVLRNLWHNKLISYTQHLKAGNENMNYDFIDMMENGPGTMCDICLIGFHHMSYLYVCSSLIEEQHDICLPCMNRNVLQYKRLQNVLNELYFIHELDAYIVSQIVYCMVGCVRLSQ